MSSAERSNYTLIYSHFRTPLTFDDFRTPAKFEFEAAEQSSQDSRIAPKKLKLSREWLTNLLLVRSESEDNTFSARVRRELVQLK